MFIFLATYSDARNYFLKVRKEFLKDDTRTPEDQYQETIGLWNAMLQEEKRLWLVVYQLSSYAAKKIKPKASTAGQQTKAVGGNAPKMAVRGTAPNIGASSTVPKKKAVGGINRKKSTDRGATQRKAADDGSARLKRPCPTTGQPGDEKPKVPKLPR